MGFFDRFRKQASTSEPHHATDSVAEHDVISDAIEAWETGRTDEAEALFRKALAVRRPKDPFELDYCAGRFAAFLLDHGRTEEAIHILREAVQRRAKIPGIWEDYLKALTLKREHEELFRAVDQMCEIFDTKDRRTAELLDHARRGARQGAMDFALRVAQRAFDETSQASDVAGRWLSGGELGRLLEQQGRLDDALQLWSQMFEEGSNEPVTANRLSMHLERKKEYERAVYVTQAALKRQLPANVEEQLRKRLVRCEERHGGRSKQPGKSSKRDVPAFSVRNGAERLTLLHQVRTEPPIRDLEVLGSVGRCMGVSKGRASIIDIDLATGSELERTDGLPEFDNIQYLSDGRGVATKRTARIGEGITKLWFLDSAKRILKEAEIPDAVSEIAAGPGLWYVGCRDGFLYGYDGGGKRLWQWETPGSRAYSDRPYLRPCPYYVASAGCAAVVASMGDLFAIDSSGTTAWHTQIPQERETKWSFSIPLGALAETKLAYETLGLHPGASYDEVKSAYRRLALETHPDRNPDKPDAAARFREVHGAYEAFLASKTSGDRVADPSAGDTLEVSLEYLGYRATASFLSANDSGVVVGSSHGRLYRLDNSGRIAEARILGDSQVNAVLRPDGSIAAAWCDGAIFFFRGQEIVNSAEMPDPLHGMTMFGDDLLVWRGGQMELMDPLGRLLWSAEFSKRVSAVVARGRHLVCAAGVLTVFHHSDMIA